MQQPEVHDDCIIKGDEDFALVVFFSHFKFSLQILIKTKFEFSFRAV